MTGPAPRTRPWLRGLAGLLLVVVLSACGSTTQVPINAAPHPPAPEGLTAADVDGWLDGYLPAALEGEGVAGASVAVVHEGQVLTERGYGYADTGADGGAPVLVDAQHTLFRVGSISKLVVATAIMQLVESGDVALDEPVADLIDFELPTQYEEPITLRHLLSHTAGFEDRLTGVILTSDDQVPTLAEAVSQDPPEQIFAPGTVPAYSNYGNALAGYVVEHVSGMDFAEYAQAHVFGPAGMETATMAQPLPEHLEPQMSAGREHLRSASMPFELIGLPPAGSMTAAAPDMSAFMLALLNDDGASATPLLSPESLELMREPAFGQEHLGGLANGPRTALGWHEQDRNGRQILGHGGDTHVFHAELQVYPETGTGIYVALNSTGVRPESTAVIREQLMLGFADRYFPDDSGPVAAEPTAVEHAEVLAGDYMLSRAGESTFIRLYSALTPVRISTAGDGTLTVDAITDASGMAHHFVESEPWVWQEIGGQERFAADVAGDQVRAVGMYPAFTMLPLPATLAAVPTVMVGVLVILLVGLLSWPMAALIRRRYRVRVQRPRGERRLRLATMVGAGLVVAATAMWAVVATVLLSGGTAPGALIRLAQVLTLLGMAGFVPAGARLAVSARRRRWWLVVRNAALSLAFAGFAYVAIVGRLLALDITY